MVGGAAVVFVGRCLVSVFVMRFKATDCLSPSLLDGNTEQVNDVTRPLAACAKSVMFSLACEYVTAKSTNHLICNILLFHLFLMRH
jgi:hypothetical protein